MIDVPFRSCLPFFQDALSPEKNVLWLAKTGEVSLQHGPSKFLEEKSNFVDFLIQAIRDNCVRYSYWSLFFWVLRSTSSKFQGHSKFYNW